MILFIQTTGYTLLLQAANMLSRADPFQDINNPHEKRMQIYKPPLNINSPLQGHDYPSQETNRCYPNGIQERDEFMC